MRILLGAFVLALVFGATDARAGTILNVSSPEYLGSVIPGKPAGDAIEVQYINYLVDMGPLDVDPSISIGGEDHTFTRSGNTLCYPGCPTAFLPLDKKDVKSLTDLDVNGAEYLLAKFGQYSYVWYVANLTSIDLAHKPLGITKGLSHYALANGTAVPDGGTTVSLLGLGLVGLSYLRRHLGAR